MHKIVHKHTHRLYHSTKIVYISFKINVHIFSNLVFKLQNILQIQIADAHAIETFVYLDIFSFYYFLLIFHQTSQCNICIADTFALEGTKICSQKIANWKKKMLKKCTGKKSARKTLRQDLAAGSDRNTSSTSQANTRFLCQTLTKEAPQGFIHP